MFQFRMFLLLPVKEGSADSLCGGQIAESPSGKLRTGKIADIVGRSCFLSEPAPLEGLGRYFCRGPSRQS
jgi:hypothetical protein